MLLSVNKNKNLPTTCSLLLRIVILALVAQLAISVPRDYRWGLGLRGLGSKSNSDFTALSNDTKKNLNLYLYRSPIELTVNYNVINDAEAKNRDAFDEENSESSFSDDNHLPIPEESEIEDLIGNDYEKRVLTPKEWIDAAFNSKNEVDYNDVEGTISERMGEPDNADVALRNERVMQKEMFMPKVPAECEGKTVCDKTESYPMEIIEQLVKKLQEDNLLIEAPSNPVNVGQRIDASDRTQNLCRSETHVTIDKAIALNGTWYYVLQTPKFVQMIENVVCVEAGKPCEAVTGFTDGPNANAVSVCVQHYIERYIHTLDQVDGHPAVVLRPLKIPSGCCCHYKN
ncbi:uncharacterized protein LOC124409908 [Diprion similis]|uniref:uncharacterized protein LOC124409908 n=1 Tax=Diprion similis TaxID=362088 RepID=UPI001EF7D5D5|nr:uncharacterized protein LOC124409908 [Diprion similis]